MHIIVENRKVTNIKCQQYFICTNAFKLNDTDQIDKHISIIQTTYVNKVFTFCI